MSGNDAGPELASDRPLRSFHSLIPVIVYSHVSVKHYGFSAVEKRKHVAAPPPLALTPFEPPKPRGRPRRGCQPPAYGAAPDNIRKPVYWDLAMKLKYSNIFDAITKNAEEAADLEFRADLMLVLRDFFREQGASQAQIGQMLGLPQPRVSELMSGKVNKFSSDKLIGFLARVGIRFRPATVPAAKGRPLRVKCDVFFAEAA